MFKSAVDNFYQSADMEIRCKQTMVHDKKQRHVETKFKVNFDDQSYTLNMYHTTSSCLVNGKMATCFCDEHLPTIMSSIETELKNGITVQDINQTSTGLLAENITSNASHEEITEVIGCDSEVQLRITGTS